MRKLDATALFATAGSSFGAGSWAPDNGLVFPDAERRPYDYYLAGEVNTGEIMVGGNSMDALGAYELPAGRTLSMLEYHEWMDETWGNETQAVQAQYPLSRFFGNTNAAYIQASGDCDVVCSQYELARVMSSHDEAQVYVYYFEYGPACGDEAQRRGLTKDWTHGNWASHAAEIPWVFGDAFACYRTAAEQRLTASMQQYWTSFAKTGVPTSSDAKTIWTPYAGGSGGNVLVFGTEIGLAKHHKEKDCALMLSPQLGCGAPPPPPPSPNGARRTSVSGK
eukprot:COSAG02_NODE_2170_length_9599_cov_5.637789_6_plen_279_part_00